MRHVLYLSVPLLTFALLGGCGARSGASDPMPAWPDVGTYRMDVEGVATGAEMSGKWESVANTGDSIVRRTEELLQTMPEKYKGSPVEQKSQEVMDAAKAYKEACATKKGKTIQEAHSRLRVVAEELSNTAGVQG